MLRIDQINRYDQMNNEIEVACPIAIELCIYEYPSRLCIISTCMIEVEEKQFSHV
jgi:hypothetical protein